MNLSRPNKLKYNEKKNLELKKDGKIKKVKIDLVEINSEDTDNIINFLMKKRNNILLDMNNGKKICNNKMLIKDMLEESKVYIFENNMYNNVPYLKLSNIGFKDGICSLENLVKVILLSDDKNFSLERIGKSKINNDEEEIVYKILGSNMMYEDMDGINLNLLDEIELEEEYSNLDDYDKNIIIKNFVGGGIGLSKLLNNDLKEEKNMSELLEVELKEKKCYDFIEGDKDINEYLKEDLKNIVIKLNNNNYLCNNKENIKKIFLDAIDYKCLKMWNNILDGFSDNTIKINGFESMIYYPHKEYVKLQKLGLGFGGICSLENLVNEILESDYQIFEIIDSGDEFYTVSKELIEKERLKKWYEKSNKEIPDNLLDMTGLNHCDSGQKDKLYKIVNMYNKEYYDEEEFDDDVLNMSDIEYYNKYKPNYIE